ncbi:hypothetical protein [Kitasatospora sp. NPDC093558]|uniref:YncE family protein n=1 Tax=Kitasatospora sp. NPDC093558 TaxID=3155201 RepID=UPI00342B2E6A
MARARWLGAAAVAGLLVATGTGTGVASAEPAGEPVAGVSQTVPVGYAASTTVVIPDGSKAYVAVTNDDDNHTGALKAVDTRTGAITAELTLDPAPSSSVGPLAVSPDGARVFAVVGQKRLVTVDTGSDTVLADVPLPVQPHPDTFVDGPISSLVAGPDGVGVYLAQVGPQSRWGGSAGRVLAYSTATGTFTAALALTTDAAGSIVLHPNGRDAYVTTGAGLVHLSARPTSLSLVRTFTAGRGASGSAVLSPDGSTLYGIGSSQSDYLVDTTTDTVTSGFRFTQGDNIRYPAISRDGRRLYLVQTSVITIPPGTPLPPGYAYRSSILSYDTVARTLVPAETVTPNSVELPGGLALGPDGHTFYLSGNSYPAGLQGGPVYPPGLQGTPVAWLDILQR